MSDHIAVANRVTKGWQSVCLLDGCGWKGPVRERNRVVEFYAADRQAEGEALDDGELHEDEAAST